MKRKLIILSGLSGSGKTTALHTLEDIGYYCVDNLPVSMLSALSWTLAETKNKDRVAVSIDARNLDDDFSDFPQLINEISSESNFDITVLFLEANRESILKRFNETRRKHPLQKPDGTLTEALNAEQKRLDGIIQATNLRVDTSAENIYGLRERIQHFFGDHNPEDQLFITVFSFGFKHGTPLDADFIFDARHLANPHWDQKLRALTGKDIAIIDFLENHQEVIDYRDHIAHFLTKWIPVINTGNRYYLTIAIGCTGGKHRSVYLSEAIARAIKPLGHKVVLRHRDCTALHLPLP